MNEQVCTKAVDTCGYPVETTGNAVLDTLEHRLLHACLRA